MSRFSHHVFICTNERALGHPKGCCNARGGVELREAFKAALGRYGLKDKVRANNAGCLDACEFGASMVVYPEAVWYGNVTVDDVDEIIQSHILNGRPVERLRIPHEAWAGAMNPFGAFES